MYRQWEKEWKEMHGKRIDWKEKKRENVDVFIYIKKEGKKGKRVKQDGVVWRRRRRCRRIFYWQSARPRKFWNSGTTPQRAQLERQRTCVCHSRTSSLQSINKYIFLSFTASFQMKRKRRARERIVNQKRKSKERERAGNWNKCLGYWRGSSSIGVTSLPLGGALWWRIDRGRSQERETCPWNLWLVFISLFPRNGVWPWKSQHLIYMPETSWSAFLFHFISKLFDSMGCFCPFVVVKSWNGCWA